MTVANFVIAGTEKAGTTSVFSYLGQHPEVTASIRKETDFFRQSGGGASDYARYFPDHCETPIVMEASPGYLGEADVVVPRMRALIPDARLLFILRDPIDRLVSSFNFHQGRLNLPQTISLHEYVDACLAYVDDARAWHNNAVGVPGLAIDEWHLKVLPFGCYARFLRHYFDAFPRQNIKVAFYDHLRRDPKRFMEAVSEFLRIDGRFWGSANLEPANVSFSGRNKLLHRTAVSLNDLLEPVLRPRPGLKSAIVKAYKRLNGSTADRMGLSEPDRTRLENYYAPHNVALEALLDRPLPSGWPKVDTTSPHDRLPIPDRRGASLR